jgi:uncharacterized protein YbjT (DUF2867 family)
MSIKSSKTAVIAGSTGLVGSELLKLLLNDPKYHQVFSVVRQKTNLAHVKLVELKINFDDLPYCLQEIKQVDDVYCCLGTTIKKAGSKEEFRKVDYHYPIELAKWAREIKAHHFLIISAMGADAGSRIFYNKIKGDVERDIPLFEIPAITIVKPSLLLGERNENRMGEKVATVFSKALSFMWKGTLKNYKPIEAEKVAAAMQSAAHAQRTGVERIKSGEMQ